MGRILIFVYYLNGIVVSSWLLWKELHR